MLSVLIGDLELRIRIARQPWSMPRIELVPERKGDGTVVLRARVRRPGEWLRELIRRLAFAA
jgi:hypothetical protein